MDKKELKELMERLIPNEELIPLTEVATVLYPRMKPGMCNYLSTYDYPVNSNKLREGRATDLRLHKYDIIMPGRRPDYLYLVDEEPDTAIYARPGSAVIRPFGILPEYLYLFLKSSVGQEMMEYFAFSACAPSTLRREDFEKIHIALPNLPEEKYKLTFRVENRYETDMSTYNALISEWRQANGENIAEIFNGECIDKIISEKNEAFKRLVKTDIDELNACFRVGAYKAALILAGSILEAVLLDWLSEKDGKNYFMNEYKSREKDNLFSYINAIKEIEKPKWMKGAEMAHDIRQKRNLVHAKLGIESSEVNKETCEKVVQYLEAVIETRIAASALSI